MMIKDKISVIIPVYNGAQWIRQCIESIQKQTYQEFEILVLDDSSKDGTPEIVKELSFSDNRIRLITRRDRGVSGARNQGIEEACGEYITFVDADDMLEEHMLERLLLSLKKGQSDIAICGFFRWNGKNEQELKEQEQKEQETKNVSKQLSEAGEDECIVPITVGRDEFLAEYVLCGYTRCWSVLYDRAVIGDTRFRTDLTIGEDMMFIVDLLPKLERITITDYKGYFYRINEQGAMLRPFTPSYMDELKSWKLAGEFIEKNYPEQKKKIAGKLAISGMLTAGKLARLTKAEQKQYSSFVKECHRTVKTALKVPGAKDELPAGYGIKTKLFVVSPWLYLNLYHLWKR